jgi:hypothetical protein
VCPLCLGRTNKCDFCGGKGTLSQVLRDSKGFSMWQAR